MLSERKTPMWQFWGSYSHDWPLLSELALKVFSMATSNAASERNFSTMGFIHSKLRNSLGRETVEKLVYLKTNNLQIMNNVHLATYNDPSETEGDEDDN
jgi:hAT family C-terminal dimerisation region